MTVDSDAGYLFDFFSFIDLYLFDAQAISAPLSQILQSVGDPSVILHLLFELQMKEIDHKRKEREKELLAQNKIVRPHPCVPGSISFQMRECN